MVPEKKSSLNTRIDKSVRVVEVVGAQASTFGGARFVDNYEFKQALLESLRQSGTFSAVTESEATDLDLRATIREQEQANPRGLEYRALLIVEYELIDRRSRRVVWRETYWTEHSSAAFAGGTRTVDARAGSVKENLALFLDGIGRRYRGIDVPGEFADDQRRYARYMSFFVTSVGLGKGADLGGLEGADRHCQSLANAVGAGKRIWRAYLSAGSSGLQSPVNARDRIGGGPWLNAKGAVIARDVDHLHGGNNLTKETALTEKGEIVKGHGESPNMHDILTGSLANGRASPGVRDTTCDNWKSGGDGAAIVGHHDRVGIGVEERLRSWNSAHRSRGCSQQALRNTGGNGLFYCFAAN